VNIAKIARLAEGLRQIPEVLRDLEERAFNHTVNLT